MLQVNPITTFLPNTDLTAYLKSLNPKIKFSPPNLGLWNGLNSAHLDKRKKIIENN
jgi:hypothetical protein